MKEKNRPNKILILHGWEGDPGLYWIPRAKRELEQMGYEVFTPKMPGGYFPKKENWLKVVEEYHPDQNWILVGHSLGGVAMLRYLEKASAPISKAVFVATPFEPMKFGPIANFFDEDFDWDKIIKNAPRREVMVESDDSVVPPNHGQDLAQKLNAKLHILPGGTHFHKIDLEYLFNLIK